jgi:hypothetical protein
MRLTSNTYWRIRRARAVDESRRLRNDVRVRLGLPTWPRPNHLPFQPLADLCKHRWRPINAAADATAGDIVRVADICGVPRHTVHRWRADGLSLRHADHAACALGLHPLEVWPDHYLPAIEAAA